MSRSSRDYERHVEMCEQEEQDAVQLISLPEFLESIGFTMVPHETIKKNNMDGVKYD